MPGEGESMKPLRTSATIVILLTLGFIALNLSGSISAVQAQQVQVTAADPSSTAQGTINLNVTVTGKGFKNGAKAKWFVTGTTDPGGVTVNSTTFVNSGELTANITVSDTAVIANFDIAVANADGRGGKGTELFAVTSNGTASCTNLAASPDGTTGYVSFSPAWSTPVNVASTCTPASTVPGRLDTCFGNNGIVATSIDPPNMAVGVVVQTDGKSVVAVRTFASHALGYFYAARYDSAGNLDPSFGSGGVVGIEFTTCDSDENLAAIALQGDGKILMAGSANIKSGISGFAVTRLNPDGSLDNTFGNGGRVLFGFAQSAGLAAMTLQSDGRILLAGSQQGNEFAVARLSTNGTLDSTFGTGGKVVVQTTKLGSDGGAFAIAIQRINTEDRIVVAGARPPTNRSSKDLAVARLTSSGALDSTFGSGGMVFTDFYGYRDTAHAVLVTGDSIIAGGSADFDGTNRFQFALAKYKLNGQLDTTFGSGGKVVTSFAGSGPILAMVLQADGKIVAGGRSVYDLGYADFSLARYNSDGSLDSTFGPSGNGKVLTDYSLADGGPQGLALQSDGKILAVGGFSVTSAGSYEYSALVRYMP
jgi:uncharacterized delta-60 repeat protein